MNHTSHRRKINIPSTIPPFEWCDFRKDYEAGMSLYAIGEKYCCDPRTVRSCIIRNKSSSELGRKSTPSILEPYHREIQQILHEMSEEEISLYKKSMAVTQRLKDSGYTGSERTVRNYLNSHNPIHHHMPHDLQDLNT